MSRSPSHRCGVIRSPIVELAYEYDQASNRVSSLNQNPALGAWSNRDGKYEFDKLHRLLKADRGKWDAPGGAMNPYAPASSTTPSLAWKVGSQPTDDNLDMLGNWNVLVTDADGNGIGTGTDHVEARDHDQANQLLSRDLDGSSSSDLEHEFDHAGNMRTQEIGPESSPVTVTYTHDLWNRLVRIDYGEDVRSAYDYNGLHWRIAKRADVTTPGTGQNPPTPVPDGILDQERQMFYSADWRLIHERIDDDIDAAEPDGVDRQVQYVWGLRYIDDIVLHRQDGDMDGNFSDKEPDGIWYHATDGQYSTVAVLDNYANLIERVSYDPYGRARHHAPEDVTGDGIVNINDVNAVIGGYGGQPNQGDIDRSGAVNINDMLADDAQASNPRPRGCGRGLRWQFNSEMKPCR